MHLDRDYLYPGGALDLERCEDLTETVRARQGEVRTARRQLRADCARDTEAMLALFRVLR